MWAMIPAAAPAGTQMLGSEERRLSNDLTWSSNNQVRTDMGIWCQSDLEYA
jgi:hypothetical protein